MNKWQKYRCAYRNYRKRTKKRRRKVQLLLISVFMIWYTGSLPDQLFNDSTSTVLLDRDGKLLGAHIARDGQWRFPETGKVPGKVAMCITEFEDRNFFGHIGISISGIGRALVQNVSRGKVVSGGSTITMQLVRLMRKNPPRTYREKMLEVVLATRLELRYSKNEILALYASHAPFGNNVVGLDAASWRYFGRDPEKLSWAESATLAVLPNAPGLIYPGKNHDRLLQKRNRLLKRLFIAGKISEESYTLALEEPLPGKPLPLPRYAPHLLERCIREGWEGKTVHSTLRLAVQEKTQQQLALHHTLMSANEIMNGAVVVTDVATGEILAYVANTNAAEEFAPEVDCIMAPRSTGSILKPLLYAGAMQNAQLLPSMLVPDIPSRFGSFAPKNYSRQFDGLVPADKALARSLNIPMVHLLNRYGVAKFREDLNRLGFTSVKRSARHYGLTLILGGAEVKLYELNGVYTRLAQDLRFGKHLPLSLTQGPERKWEEGSGFDRGCIYAAFEALLEVNRPDEDNNWRLFGSSRKIAWKTGTSFGFRDAWAVGITPDYVVSVWVGNADGEGRRGLTGVKTAAPVLFDVFRQLPAKTDWFAIPRKEMQQVDVCSESGYRATEYCTSRFRQWVPNAALQTGSCPYHKLVHLDHTGTFRVTAECEEVFHMQHKRLMVLPPAIERYYRTNHPEHRPLPEMHPDCRSAIDHSALHLIYPKSGSRIIVPYGLDGTLEKVIFEAGHRTSGMVVYWHLDDLYLGQTETIHELELLPEPGKHRLTLTDEQGRTVSVDFEVDGKLMHR